jgi:predicted dehydrogenase
MIGKRKYNFALIGAGRMGTRWAKIINDFPETPLKIVIDKNLRQAKKLAQIYDAAFSENYKDALGSGIDAIAVVTPHKYLYFLSRAALLAGKNVFVEKPGSRTAGEMEKLLFLAKRKKLSLMVGFNYRFFDAIRHAKKIVDRGEIGTINFIRIKHGHPGRPGYNKEWRMNKNIAGGGVLMDQGLHVIDLVNWFFSEPISKVVGLTSNLFWESSVEDNAFLLLKSVKNKIASLHVGVTEWKPIFVLEIFCSKGYCIINGLGKKYGGKEILTVGKYNHKKQILKEKSIICNPDPDNSLRLEFVEFLNAIAGKKEPSPGGQDALRVLEIIKSVYNSVV